MRLAIFISLLFLAAAASVYFAPESKTNVIDIEFTAPPLRLQPYFPIPPVQDCDAYYTDPWTEQKALQRCTVKI